MSDNLKELIEHLKNDPICFDKLEAFFDFGMDEWRIRDDKQLFLGISNAALTNDRDRIRCALKFPKGREGFSDEDIDKIFKCIDDHRDSLIEKGRLR